MSKNKKGFTIIEVVLVLAIAGLIFLMVFIALPALQRSQRNTRRRQDMARILSAINDYQANNNGKSPAKLNGTTGVDGNSGTKEVDTNFIARYVDDTCTVSNNYSYVGGTVTLADYSCTGDQFRDPDGSNYNMIFGAHSLATYWGEEDDGGWYFLRRDSLRENHRIVLAVDAKCSGNESRPITFEDAGGDGSVAIVYVLEGNATYCGDNQ